MGQKAILVADEDVESLKLIKNTLGTEINVLTASDIVQAKEIMIKEQVQVIVANQAFDGMSGIEFFKKTNELNPDAVRIVLANYADAESLLDIINESNVFRYILKPWDPYELRLTINNAFEKFEMAEENRKLVERLKENYSKTVMMLANALEARDSFAQGHSERVGYSSVCIAKKMGFDQNDTDMLYSACLLHDIGKIGVPEGIFKKQEKLDEEDMMYIKSHTTIGERILSPIPAFGSMIPIIRHHHERFDGKGYPDGLKGTEIPIFARIVAVADTFDAITSDRPYRKGLTYEEGIRILEEEEKGRHLDPQIVDLFVSMLKERNITSIWELE